MLAYGHCRLTAARAASDGGQRGQPRLDCEASGLTNRQIAQDLVLQESTVGNHLQRIYARLELKGRAQLAAWVAEHDQASEPRP
jgi:DNA-binding CsgD family transcriptional regulator